MEKVYKERLKRELAYDVVKLGIKDGIKLRHQEFMIQDFGLMWCSFWL